jgi:hypothetical protein
MTAMIFVGPTLAPAEIAAAGDFVCLAPVAQGDVYRAARRGARLIGIIDGYFSGAPAVWHKEILWAMSEGVAVFGSASMGALRAAELHAFGMRGVGRIFEAYRDGALEDDDEVAVLHGPAEIGYLGASEPMVNIRATLEAAEQNGVIGAATRVALESFGKSLFFGERSWPSIMKAAPRLGVADFELVALEDWLPEGRIDQKRRDALAMLAEMRAASDGKLAPPNFHFERTYLWDVFVARSALTDGPSASASAEPLLDELRLEGSEAYRRAEAQALLRFFTSTGSRAPDVPHEAARDRLARFRAERGLYGRADLERWMSANDLDPPELEALIKDEAKIEALRDRIGRSIDGYLLDALRASGDYPRLADRARRKHEALAAAGQSAARPNALESVVLRIWRFEKRLGEPVPDDVQSYAARLGFADLAAFDLALYRERVFLSLAPDSA